MEEITWKQLAISGSKYIHVDNDATPQIPNYRTYCGITVNRTLEYLTLDNVSYKIKICKKCSIIYRRKYGHSLEGFIAGLKVRNKLFIDN